MRLVDGVGIFVAELRDDALDPVEVSGLERFADKAFELESTALPLVVELVVQGFRDIGVHGESLLICCGATLHGRPV